MSDIQQKLDDYLADKDTTEYYPEQDTELMDRMLEFIINLNTESLSEEQLEEASDIINELADDPLDEAFSAKKVKIKPGDKRKRKMEYRRSRAKIKLNAKKFRRTTKFKQWKRMKKRRAGQGKTARGKRIRKFL